MPIFKLEGENTNSKLILAKATNLEFESDLEDWLENSPWALVQDELILWVDRQPKAKEEESTIFPDLLGVDAEGNLVIVEFKRGKTPRKVVAQLLEYAAWAKKLSEEDIQEISGKYFEKREEFRGKHFNEVFKKVFEIPDNDDVPPLKHNLRLFIVAEEITDRIVSVCRFLRTSYRIDISCISVSLFQTDEFGEKFVSMETKVGDENLFAPAPIVADGPKIIEVVREAIKEITGEKTNVEFAPKDVKKILSEKYPGFKLAGVNFNIGTDTVNQNTYDVIPKSERKLWRVAQGKYRLHDPEKDKVEGNGIPTDE